MVTLRGNTDHRQQGAIKNDVTEPKASMDSGTGLIAPIAPIALEHTCLTMKAVTYLPKIQVKLPT